MHGPLNGKFVNTQGQLYTSNVIGYVSIPKSNSENSLQSSLCLFLLDSLNLTFKRRIKSHLPFASIIRSSPYSTSFQDKG